KSRLIYAVSYTSDRLRMPPKGRLADAQIADLKSWIRAGGVWPETKTSADADGSNGLFTDEQKQFWAFQPIRDPSPPRVREVDWVRSPIDRFILTKLEERGLRPARPADKHTLLRRVTFDLTGLPPTPNEIDDYLRDTSPDAFEKVID